MAARDPIGGDTADGIDDAYAIVSVVTAGGKVLAYASLVDNRTNDPVLIVTPDQPDSTG